MTTPRRGGTATGLPDGTVLITGGRDNNDNSIITAELYDPNFDTFFATSGNMNVSRADHSATLLNDGTVLIAGGETDSNNGNSFVLLNSAEIYDPSTGKFTLVGNSMTDFRDDSPAVLIKTTGTSLDNKVLLVGGFSDVDCETTAEVYDPVQKTFTATSTMNFGHAEALAAQIP
jgi:hypothetical protein